MSKYEHLEKITLENLNENYGKLYDTLTNSFNNYMNCQEQTKKEQYLKLWGEALAEFDYFENMLSRRKLWPHVTFNRFEMDAKQ